MTLIYAIILFVLLIFPHELGHFLVAKAVGVKVNEFSFGMGPALLQRQRGETVYSVRLIPVGGYCAMEGEDGDSEDERAFSRKPGWAKISVLLAGAGMNVLIAIIVLSLVMGIMGEATTAVEKVSAGSPAAEAGIAPGDRILAINEKKIEEWQEISEEVSRSPEGIEVTVERQGKPLTVNLIPEKQKDSRLIIGVTAKIAHNPLHAVQNGVRGTWNMTKGIFSSLKMLFTGEAPVSDLAGPVGIISMVGDTNQYGLYYFGFLVALISLNLALMNLLPLPALDGGRILFVLIRGITGKKITDEMEGRIHALGMVLLIGLLIFATWNDIVRLFS